MLLALYLFLIVWYGTGNICLVCAAFGRVENYDKWMNRAGLTLLTGFAILVLGLTTYVGWGKYHESNVERTPSSSQSNY